MTRNPNDNELPRTMNWREARRLLEGEGWAEERGGKHVVKMVKEGHRPVTLPLKQGSQYGKGLTAKILREAGLGGNDDR